MNQEKVNELLQEALAENESIFLVDIDFLPSNKIKIVLDGDSGITLDECIRVSRKIEHNLDREEEDFSLEVSSPDIAAPIKLERQYKKNLNRILEVKTNDQSVKGTLTEITDKGITLAWKSREPKPIGKGKITVEKSAVIPFTEIIEAKVKIIF